MRASLQVWRPAVFGRSVAVFLALMCLLSAPPLYAQHTVRGVVSDENDDPVIGANVIVKGTTQGVSTGVKGDFSLSVPLNAILQFSALGYAAQELSVGQRTYLEVRLVSESQQIEDVVVVGYGSQKKVNLTGSVGAVRMDEQLASRSVSNVSTALQGLVPGLSVNQNTAMAGKNGASLMIRGLGTVNNAAPLIVVDGMPDVDINRLNINDIESISVLKDASSSAVYGSRAANGVVLITTKTGSDQKGKAKINFTGSYAFSEPIKMIELMPDYPRAIQAMILASEAGGGTSRFRWGAVEEWAAKSIIDPVRYPNTDWMDLTSRTGSLQNYSLSASGGNERSSFYISAAIMDEEGIHMSDDFTRYNTRFNYNYKIRDNIRVGARFDGSWHKWNYSRDDGWYVNSGSGGLISAIAGVTPYDPETGHYGGSMMYGEDATIFNPLREYDNTIVTRNRQDMFAGIDLEWEPIKGLKVGVDYNLTYANQLVKNYNMPHSEWNMQTGKEIRVLVGPNAGVTDQLSTNYRTLLNSRLGYSRSFGRHDVSALVVYSEEYAFSRSNSAGRDTRLHPSLTEVNAALTEVQRAGGTSSAWGLRSYIGRLNYAFSDKYLFEASFRYDGSSKFQSGHQYGFFPSASAGWRFTEEQFLSFLNRFMSSGKLRVSYGSLGNNSGVGNYQQRATLVPAHYTTGGKIAVGLVDNKMINPDLTWETTRVFNLGLDVGFFRNQLTAEIDYYNRRTVDMLRPDELSSLLSGAYSAPMKNIGILRNQGVELTLNWRDNIKDFEYRFVLNASYNANRLEQWNSYLARGNVYIDMPYQFVYRYVNRGGVIQSWQDIYNAPFQNKANSPGDMLLEDLNGDGVIDGDDRKAQPRYNELRPSANFGLNMMASWKGFDLSLLWTAAAGRKTLWANHFNNVQLMAAAQSLTYTQYYDSWNYDNRGGMLPRLVTGTRGRQKDASSYWLDDMAYLRLKNVQLGYNIPSQWLKKIGISQVRLYVSAENLWTWTNYRGLDPEKALTGTGSENDAYPMLRTISFGLNIGL